jgi:hypothetical protein
MVFRGFVVFFDENAMARNMQVLRGSKPFGCPNVPMQVDDRERSAMIVTVRRASSCTLRS